MKVALSTFLILLLAGCTQDTAEIEIPSVSKEKGWIEVPSSIDGRIERSYFQPAISDSPRPMVVFLHPWDSSSRFRNPEWELVFEEADWHFLYPNFRGPNNNPDACGSEKAQKDILDAIGYVRVNFSIDHNKVFLAGVEGGGHMALLMAGKYPERFAGVSAWGGIYSIEDFYKESNDKTTLKHFKNDIVKVVGGYPRGTNNTPERDAELSMKCLSRSPQSTLNEANPIAFDINAGINDGHEGPISISHSIDAFNSLVAQENRIEYEVAERLLKQDTDPTWAVDDQSYPEENAVLFRRVSGNRRLTIFDGENEGFAKPTLEWFKTVSRSE